MTRDDAALMQNIALFKEMPPEGLRILWEASDSRRIRGGEVIFQQGQVGDYGILLLRGSILLSTTPSTQDIILTRGHFVGEMALLIEQRRQVTAIAREECQILKISSSAFKKVLAHFPQAAIAAGQVMQLRLHNLMTQLDGVKHKFED
jgi:CRP-like cAMP-binding protein